MARRAVSPQSDERWERGEKSRRRREIIAMSELRPLALLER